MRLRSRHIPHNAHHPPPLLAGLIRIAHCLIVDGCLADALRLLIHLLVAAVGTVLGVHYLVLAYYYYKLRKHLDWTPNKGKKPASSTRVNPKTAKVTILGSSYHLTIFKNTGRGPLRRLPFKGGDHVGKVTMLER